MSDAPMAEAAPLLTIVMPAYNETEILDRSVEDVVVGMRERKLPFELLIVENGSTDDTFERAQGIAARFTEVGVLQRAEADYGAALREGLLTARGAAVVNFDCDYYDLEFLDRSVALVSREGGPTVVVGSKRAPGADDRRAWPRRLVTAVFAMVLRLVFGLRVSDTHGMKAMRRDAVVPFARECRLGRDLFDTELILRVERAGLETAEIPVAVEERRPARTSIARRLPRTVVGLGRLWRALRRER